MPYLGEIVNTEAISMDQAVEAYAKFDTCSLKKYVVDRHGSIKARSVEPPARRTRRAGGFADFRRRIHEHTT